VKVPKQRNGIDCGLFICRYAYSILQRELNPITFETESKSIRVWLLSLIIESSYSSTGSSKVSDLIEEIKTDMVNDSSIHEVPINQKCNLIILK
jgi:hypothetical protein